MQKHQEWQWFSDSLWKDKKKRCNLQTIKAFSAVDHYDGLSKLSAKFLTYNTLKKKMLNEVFVKSNYTKLRSIKSVSVMPVFASPSPHQDYGVIPLF